MRRLRRDEGGWALVTAVFLMTFMLGSSLALSTYMDGLTTQSSITRVREASFNTAETVLSSQITSLTRNWPQTVAWPSCTPASTDVKCPAASTMQALHDGPDTRTGLGWTTSVRDDPGGDASCSGSFYDDAAMATVAQFDANGNGCLWIRAQGTVRNRTRTLVALVRSQRSAPTLPPEFAVYAGRVDFDSNAIRTFVTGGKVAARCTPTMGETVACAGYPLGSSKATDLTQLQASYSASVGSRDATWNVDQPTMSTTDQAAFKQRAKDLGTYYTTCPPTLTGAVVWVEGNLNCSYSGNLVYNSPTKPGLLVMDGGKLNLDGFVQYHGIIYFPNTAGSTATLFDLQGGAKVHGAVFADGDAVVNVGTNGDGNITYTPYAFEATRLPGTAGVVQNTWRELPPSSVVR